MSVEPVPGQPAAVASLPDGDALVVADFHAGIETGLRKEGVEIASRAEARRELLLELLDQTGVESLIWLGDLQHARVWLARR